MKENFGKDSADRQTENINSHQELEKKIRFLEQQNRILQRELETNQRCLDDTRKSWTYRIGSAITFPLRMLRQAVRKVRNRKSKNRTNTPLRYFFKIDNGYLNITHICSDGTEELGTVPLEHIYWGGKIEVPMLVDAEEFNRILWVHNMAEKEFSLTGEYKAKGLGTGVICAYTNRDTDHICLFLLSTMEQIYKRFAHCRYEKVKLRLGRKRLFVCVKGQVTTEKELDLTITKAVLSIDANHHIDVQLNEHNKGKREFSVVRKIDISSIVSQETEINNPIRLSVSVCGTPCVFNVGKKRKSKLPTKFYYLPFSSTAYSDYILFLRKNINQNITLVVRKKEQEEKELSFRILESKAVSAILYFFGKLWRKLRRRKIDLYFEKNSMKAEEGTYQLFEKAASVSDTSNYFILDKRSAQWETLSQNKKVVGKYTLFYYWLLYTSDCFISTETSSHLNVHRAKNYYVRKALLERPLIFLQHGVTYLKRQGAGSVFGKGKEGEPLYIAVGSDKERDIVCEMLKLTPDRCMKTGLPIFDTIPYMHINEGSADTVTVMFTWKPSEEHLLSHFEDSFYYQSVRNMYRLLCRYISPDNIRIVPHPKVLELLSSTDMEPQIWKGTVSAVLKETKLLITDYSSVCYNAFYQGAAIIFYQPDLEAYEKEVGKLIPKDEEYIGHRAFDLDTVKTLLDAGIKNGKISLSFFRRERDVEMYKSINEFSDGKNTNRILDFLIEKGVI